MIKLHQLQSVLIRKQMRRSLAAHQLHPFAAICVALTSAQATPRGPNVLLEATIKQNASASWPINVQVIKQGLLVRAITKISVNAKTSSAKETSITHANMDMISKHVHAHSPAVERSIPHAQMGSISTLALVKLLQLRRQQLQQLSVVYLSRFVQHLLFSSLIY